MASETIRARGEGGAVWTFDLTPAVVEKLEKGQLVPVGDDGNNLSWAGSAADPDDLDLARASVKKVLDWVGDDPDRAEVALAFETSERGKPRKSVVAKLEKVLGGEG